MKHLIWPDEAATAAFAQALARQAALRGAFIELEGDLGAGKTTFVRHLLRALGVQGRIKSPTYTVVEPYELVTPTGQAWHFDFYRFQDPREWEDAGFRDIFTSPGLKLAEWAVHARAALPTPDLVVRLSTLDDEARDVQVLAYTPLGERLLAGLNTRPIPHD